jgi:phage recombination protein Bet
MNDDELLDVLGSSIYPGAKPASIKLAVGYCRAAGLDPLQKPVHLVPMRVKVPGGGRDDYEWRDVVMPGIGLYRTQASRTGELAGIDEPEFGPDVAMPGMTDRVVPQWARVTVYRMIAGQRVPFTAREFWTENYATKRSDGDAPNAMWARRPYGQLAKCAEAQALRKAFPELGSQPTADETLVEPGDVFDAAPVAPVAPRVARKPATIEQAPEADRAPPVEVEQRDPAPASKPTAKPAASKPAASGGDRVGAGEVAYLKNKATALGVELDEVLSGEGVALDTFTREEFARVKAALMARDA